MGGTVFFFPLVKQSIIWKTTLLGTINKVVQHELHFEFLEVDYTEA